MTLLLLTYKRGDAVGSTKIYAKEQGKEGLGTPGPTTYVLCPDATYIV